MSGVMLRDICLRVVFMFLVTHEEMSSTAYGVYKNVLKILGVKLIIMQC